MNTIRDPEHVWLRDPPIATPKTLSLAPRIKELRNKIASLPKQWCGAREEVEQLRKGSRSVSIVHSSLKQE